MQDNSKSSTPNLQVEGSSSKAASEQRATEVDLNANEKKAPLWHVWVDADACPKLFREVIFNASDRYLLDMTFVANQPVGIKTSKRIKSIQVAKGSDVADQEIIKRMQAGDLVITQDIPFAAEVVAKGGVALSLKGELLTADNVKARLHMRDYMDALRTSGINTGGSPVMGPREKKAFADGLEKVIVKLLRQR